MTEEKILSELTLVFCKVLDLPDICLSKSTTASDVEEWDSLSHIMLIVAIENQFNIKFTSLEIQSWRNVGEMIACIQQRVQ